LEFELYDTGQGYIAVTNLDYGKINALYHGRVSPKHSTISTEYLLSFIQDARAETYFAANYSAELVTIPLLSDLIGDAPIGRAAGIARVVGVAAFVRKNALLHRWRIGPVHQVPRSVYGFFGQCRSGGSAPTCMRHSDIGSP
jgi:hypothetical protein